MSVEDLERDALGRLLPRGATRDCDCAAPTWERCICTAIRELEASSPDLRLPRGGACPLDVDALLEQLRASNPPVAEDGGEDEKGGEHPERAPARPEAERSREGSLEQRGQP